ncbi:MAG: hypothetical protein NTX45_22835 [Proteobacteria bacterium]|nr:hypothetical protein [Pseudomonadota bacterium]
MYPDFTFLFPIKKIGSGMHFAIIGSLARINGELDKSLLARLDTLYTVGFYSAALRCIDIIMLPVIALLDSALVRFFREGEKGIYNVLILTRKIIIIPLIFTLLSGLMLPIIANLLPLILGSSFNESATVLNWLIFLPSVFVLRYFVVWIAYATKHENLTTRIYLLAIFTNLGISISLIPKIGWRGTVIAIYSSEITMILFLIFSIWIAESNIKRKWFCNLRK